MIIEIKVLTPPISETQLNEISQILHASVNAGAAISFIKPFSIDDAREFWENSILPSAQNDERLIFIAIIDHQIVGTVQLITQLPPNQKQRSEVAKLIVHPEYRRKGIAKALMIALEKHARRLDKSLITLDTKTGDNAEPLYTSLGYKTAGIIPNFAVDPDGVTPHATTYMYKILS